MSNENLAARLLPILDNHPNAASVLFGLVDNHVKDISVSVLPDGEAAVATRLPVGKAAAIAAAVRSPEQLNTLARSDARRTVRRAIAANPSTSAATLSLLWTKSLHDDDLDTLVLLCQRTPLDLIASTWHRAFGSYRFRSVHEAANAVLKRVVQSTDPSDALTILASGQALPAGLVLSHVCQSDSAVTLTEAVNAIPAERLAATLSVALANTQTISEELAKLFVTHSSWEEFHRNFTGNMYLPWGYPKRECTPEALGVLLDETVLDRYSINALCTSPAPVEHVSELVRRAAACAKHDGSLYALADVLRVNAEHLCGEDVRLALSVLDGHDQMARDRVADLVVEDLPADTAIEVVFDLFERIPERAMTAFLGGTAKRLPQPGEISAWVAANGNAELSESRRELLAMWCLGRANRYHYTYLPEASFTSVADKPWADEVIDALGDKLSFVVLQHSAVAAHVAKRSLEVLGDNPDSWRTLLSLAENLGSEPLDDLLSAVKLLTPERPAVEMVPASAVQPVGGQLALF